MCAMLRIASSFVLTLLAAAPVGPIRARNGGFAARVPRTQLRNHLP
jgi:hypothetical protein